MLCYVMLMLCYVLPYHYLHIFVIKNFALFNCSCYRVPINYPCILWRRTFQFNELVEVAFAKLHLLAILLHQL